MARNVSRCVRHFLTAVCRDFYADLHRCACQCPGSGMTMFFPGQKPLPDGHGGHALPPPARMYVPFWQGRHWPARGIVLVERLGSRRHRPRRVQGHRNATIAPASALLPTEDLADSARTLFFDKAEARAVAAEELQTVETSSRGPQRPRLHGASRRTLPVIVTVLKSPADPIGCMANNCRSVRSELLLFQARGEERFLGQRRGRVSRKKEEAAAGG